jgi:thiol-disulfide isomerase/thioredoxin
VDEAVADRTLVVRLIDTHGTPVVGALVGLGKIRFGSEDEKHDPSSISNDAGSATLSIDPDTLGLLTLTAAHKRRQIIGLRNLDEVPPSGTVTLTMKPACRVAARVISSELAARNEQLVDAEIRITLDDRVAHALWSEHGDFSFLLPPGSFTIRAFSSSSPTHSVERALNIRLGQCNVQLGRLDLPITRLKQLEGHDAPEFRDVIAWKNTGPLQLSRLRGKVVLLDFWGWWCGACTYKMPELFKLHDKYHAKGLMIIGVHVDAGDTIDSVLALDEKLAADRTNLWGGRDIPYPVALLKEERTPFHAHGSAGKARSHLAAAYGVQGYPTMVLIDRQGRIVGRFTHQPGDVKALTKLLGE